MNDFSESHWARSEFGQEYIDNADIYIVERRRLFEILKSFYSYFVKTGPKKQILDLGCGDGVLIDELSKMDGAISATLLDASEDMLLRAKERLKDFKDTRFVRATFDDIINGKTALDANYDFVVSSQAIHHFTLDKKESLFRLIHERLSPGGYLVNIDVILAPSEKIERWYMSLWSEWISERQASLKIARDFTDIIRRYKDNKDNKPDTLDDQLTILRDIGFRNVDCFYKYGIFVIYGGQK